MNLSTQTLNTIRKQLSARREELRTRLMKISADQHRETDALSADAPDRAIQRENDDVIDSIGAAAAAELAEIDRAFARMDSGHYGICEDCQHEIEQKRLVAVPYATRCLRCTSEPGVRTSAA